MQEQHTTLARASPSPRGQLLCDRALDAALSPELAYSDVYARIAATPDLRPERLELQRFAARLLYRPDVGDSRYKAPFARLQACHTWLRKREDGPPGVTLLHSAAAGRAYYSGLQTCGSVWVCPVCAGTIAEHRKAELQQGLDVHRSRGGKVILVTLTASHHHQRLAPFLEAFKRAQRRLYASRAYKELCCKLGAAGAVSATETPWSAENGWHVHGHELLFAAASTPALRHHARKVLTKEFLVALRAEGLSASDRRCVDVRDASWDAEEYLTKQGHERTWDKAAELTMGNRKRGLRELLTPFDLLRVIRNRGGRIQPDRAGALFREYAAATFGKHQLQWSRGLRAQLGLDRELSDEAIAAGAEKVPDMRELGFLSPLSWSIVVANDVRGELLAAAAGGQADEVTVFLAQLGATWMPAAERYERYLNAIADAIDSG